MFFEIKDLELHPIEFAERFEPGAVDLGSDYRQITPIESSGRADLVEEHYGKHKTISQIVAIIALLVTDAKSEWPAWLRDAFWWAPKFAEVTLWITVALTASSGLIYLWRNREIYLSDM